MGTRSLWGSSKPVAAGEERLLPPSAPMAPSPPGADLAGAATAALWPSSSKACGKSLGLPFAWVSVGFAIIHMGVSKN